ncbi:MAG TPA: hypothetical protein VNI78_00375 [Vicinamibacterales bacterium]|nr:hypothetical protein [Vicinamibacterales bacterium]
MGFQPVLTSHVREPGSYTLDFYLTRLRGYQALRKALAMPPGEIIEQVKASGLRGRGGAGFPTGLKWQFVLKDTPKPKYICCNADESEPGTFKDHVLMERNPHLLIEGCAIACYAIGAKVAYIYIRGEFYHVQQVLEAEIARAYEAGFLGRNILAAGSTATSMFTAGRARTRRARRRRSSSRSRASAPSRASSRRFRRSRASTSARRRSTTSRRSATCRSSCSTDPSGSPRSAPRRTAAPSCSA